MSLGSEIRRIATLPRRCWRSRGFGIHSPLAYSLVTQTLAESCEYYCYDRLRRLAPNYDEFMRLALVVRLVSRQQPQSVAVVGETLAAEAVKLADSRAMVVGPEAVEAELVIVGRGADVDRIPQGSCYFVYDVNGSNAVLWERLAGCESGAMLFTDLHDGVVYRRADLPRQIFEIQFGHLLRKTPIDKK